MTELKRAMPKILVVIVDREKTSQVTSLLAEERVHFFYSFLGEGTANSEILSFLGLGSTDKAVILCIERAHRVADLLVTVGQKLHMHKRGLGIAFTMPLSGINSPAFQLLGQPEKEFIQKKVDNAVEELNKGIQNDLILAVINEGYSEELMVAARQAGATGGTVLRGRRLSCDNDDSNLFGICIQEEKDIVAVLCTREKKAEIMKSINQAVGLRTEAQGVIVALPVDGVAGISTAAPTENNS